MTTVDIEYCVPCGKLPQAADLQNALLTEYGQNLEAVSLVTGDGGIFEVRVDDEVVYDSDDEGFDQSAIVDRVGDRVSATA